MKQVKKTVFWVGVGALLLSSIFFNIQIPKASAALPDGIFPGSGVTSADYAFALVDNSPVNYIFSSADYYADGAAIYGNHVNFTNTALSAAANHVQTFGIGSPDSNITLASVNVASVVVNDISCSITTCNVLYYYGSESVTTVKVTNHASSTVIPSNSFYTNQASFNAASAPAVYKNTTGGYLQVKSTKDATALSNTFYFTPSEDTEIWIDLGSSKSISTLQLTHPDASMIPSTVQVYVTNNPNSLTTLAATISPSANTAQQTFTFSSAQSGRYVVLKVTDWGTATSWQISDFSVRSVTNSEALAAQNTINSNVALILNIASYGLVIMALLMIFGERIGLNIEP